MRFAIYDLRFTIVARVLLVVSSFFILHSALAQTVLEAPGLAEFKKVSSSGGGGGGTPSYSNAGGTGNRTSIITVTRTVNLLFGAGSTLVDGNDTGNSRNFWNNETLDGSTWWVTFDFGSGKQVLITEAKYYQQDSTSEGTWQWQGSNDGSTWTSIGGTFTLGGVATQTITTLSGNTTSYRYYRLLGISGVTNNGPWIYQFEFKIFGL
jgi:hypothetical protein